MSWIGEPHWPRERLWLWRLGFPAVCAVATTLVPIRVEGREHLPARGGYILASNHISWYDPPAIEFGLRLPVRYMAKREVFAWPIVGGIVRGIGCFPIRRGEADRRALETALAVVEAGQPLGFFPEGTRSKDGALRRARPGIGFLARRSGAPIVPLAVTGTRDVGFKVPLRTDVVIRIGGPFRARDVPGVERMDDQELADAVMRRVAELLPAEMRGPYASRDYT